MIQIRIPKRVDSFDHNSEPHRPHSVMLTNDTVARLKAVRLSCGDLKVVPLSISSKIAEGSIAQHRNNTPPKPPTICKWPKRFQPGETKMNPIHFAEATELWQAHAKLYQTSYDKAKYAEKGAAKREQAKRLRKEAAEERALDDPNDLSSIRQRLWDYDGWVADVRSKNLGELSFAMLPPTRGTGESEAVLKLHTDTVEESGRRMIRSWSSRYDPSTLQWLHEHDRCQAVTLFSDHGKLLKKMRLRNDTDLRERESKRQKAAYANLTEAQKQEKFAQGDRD